MNKPNEKVQNKDELGVIIRKEIEFRGMISFAEYMAQALYHPILGYYTSPAVKIGREGDYYTSSSVAPFYGACLAKQFNEMWEVLGSPETFVLVEFGAGDGQLAQDILSRLRDNYPDFYRTLKYYIIEISPFHRKLQHDKLFAEHPEIYWVADLEQINHELIGCVFSNEFLDALPVHRIVRQGASLKEVFVKSDGEKLLDVLDEISMQEITAYLKETALELEDNQEIEVNLEAIEWLRKTTANLKKGFILTIDYGYEQRELSMPQRLQGTLMCYYQHKANTDPYINIGKQDITAHVNFSALKQFGSKFGLETAGLTTQMKFLVGLGIMNFVEQPDLTPIERQKGLLAIKRLIMPQGMGESFRILIQQKGINQSYNLSGLKGF